ncbi:MauE/DoxX family redox-associated membrane protein [Streptomyces sp. NPDC058955]|uniref:MauE/DoxX family redox-associated membrane protein n=1 Tax=unclassified Streptomyces TaxID=2593676 RepID=UPI00364AAD1D
MTDSLILAVRCVVAVVLAASALGKARAPGDFRATVRDMRVVPARLTGAVAVAVPVLEAGLAAAVWVPALTTWAFAVSFGLIAAFTAALVSVLRRKIDTSCSCFGASRTRVGPAHLVRNAVLLGATAAGFLAALAAGGPGSVPAAGSLDLGGVLVSLLGAVCVSALVLSTDLLADVFSAPNGTNGPTGPNGANAPDAPNATNGTSRRTS